MQIIRNTTTQMLLAGILFSGFTITCHALSSESLENGYPSLAPMLEKVTGGVVRITTTRGIPALRTYQFYSRDGRGNFFFEPGTDREHDHEFPNYSQGSGSGVIIDADDGYIVTNHHVIEGAESITVFLEDRRQFTARLVGTDRRTDIALLQIEAEDLVAIPLSNIDDLKVGDYTVVIGHPFGVGFGYAPAVTSGIISALGRAIPGGDNYQDYIQTDATINKGNSGGALVDLEGKLIGINTAIYSPSGGSDGIGFAVPVDMMLRVVELLERDGEVRRGLLGITMRDMNPQIAKAMDSGVNYGALVVSVLENSAAEQAGLEVSDVIVEISGEMVRDGRQLRNIVGLLTRGEEIKLLLYRDGRRMTIDAAIGGDRTVAAVRPSQPTPFESAFRGVVLRTFDKNRSATGIDLESGVEVISLPGRSRAALAGLRKGDIIYRVNRTEVENLQEFNQAIDDAEEISALSIIRDRRKMIVILT